MIDKVLDWLTDNFKWLLPCAILLIVGFLVAAAYQDEYNWRRFKAEHNCVKVSETASQVLVRSDGKTYTQAGTVTYKCDDGVLYTRSQ